MRAKLSRSSSGIMPAAGLVLAMSHALECARAGAVAAQWSITSRMVVWDRLFCGLVAVAEYP
jgi:hypothetical protein